MASLALRIMDGSATAGEQQNYAQRLIAAGNYPVIDGEVTGCVAIVFPAHTVDHGE
jgi:hypothetical protein